MTPLKWFSFLLESLSFLLIRSIINLRPEEWVQPWWLFYGGQELQSVSCDGYKPHRQKLLCGHILVPSMKSESLDLC